MSALAWVLATSVLGQASYPDAIKATDGLAGYWRFEEPSGTATAADVTGQNPATYGTLELGIAGALGSDGGTGFRCAGTGQVLLVPATAALQSTPATAELWVRIDSVGDTTVNRSVFRQTEGSDRHWYFGFLPGDAGSKMVFNFTPPSSTNYQQVLPVLPMTLNQWHLVDLILGSQRSALYLDGTLLAQISPNVQPATVTEPIYLGCVTSGAFSFDELSLYDRALTDDEIRGHYRVSQGLLADGGTPVADAGVSEPPNAFAFSCNGAPNVAALWCLASWCWAVRRRSD